jgi:hypothetical protein
MTQYRGFSKPLIPGPFTSFVPRKVFYDQARLFTYIRMYPCLDIDCERKYFNDVATPLEIELFILECILLHFQKKMLNDISGYNSFLFPFLCYRSTPAKFTIARASTITIRDC